MATFKRSANAQKVVDELSIVDYINWYIAPVLGTHPVSEHRISMICPFHHDTDPSFHLYLDTKTFKCFGCGVAGDVITLHRLWMKERLNTVMSYKEALVDLAKRHDIQIELDENGEVKEESVFELARKKADISQYTNKVFDMSNLSVVDFTKFNNQLKTQIKNMPYVMPEQVVNMYYRLDLQLSASLYNKKMKSLGNKEN